MFILENGFQGSERFQDVIQEEFRAKFEKYQQVRKEFPEFYTLILLCAKNWFPLRIEQL